MNIQELQSERDALQGRLRSYIREELASFQIVTGVGVSSVNIDFIYSQTIGETRRDYFVDQVYVGLEI